MRCQVAIAIALLVMMLGCSEDKPEAQAPAPEPEQVEAPAQGETPETVETEIDEQALADLWPLLGEPLLGDLDALAERGYFYIGIPFSAGWFFIDQGKQRGFGREQFLLLQEFAREQLGKDKQSLKLALLPARRDQLIPLLLEGHIAVILADMTITPEREAVIDFATPWYTEAREVLVTGPGAPEINTLEDLAGQEVVARAFTSYYQSLLDLNQRFADEGKPEMTLSVVPPHIDDPALLSMVNTGLFPMLVTSGYKMANWQEVFPNTTLREDIVLREGASIAMGLRKDSPQLKALLDAFMAKYPVGSLTTNVLLKRYIDTSKWVKQTLDEDAFAELGELRTLFDKYGEQYGFDPLALASFAYQESKFDQGARSKAGAVGIMQILPTTAADKLVGIPDISSLENNIHAGTKYLAVLRDRYFASLAETPVEQMLFTMAGYNAGPNRINRLRKEAEERGLDPNIWFDNVEGVVAASVGMEPVIYVSNIFRYYLAYQRLDREKAAREQMREELQKLAPTAAQGE